jgi:hypothetical protein
MDCSGLVPFSVGLCKTHWIVPKLGTLARLVEASRAANVFGRDSKLIPCSSIVMAGSGIKHYQENAGFRDIHRSLSPERLSVGVASVAA